MHQRVLNIVVRFDEESGIDVRAEQTGAGFVRQTYTSESGRESQRLTPQEALELADFLDVMLDNSTNQIHGAVSNVLGALGQALSQRNVEAASIVQHASRLSKQIGEALQ